MVKKIGAGVLVFLMILFVVGAVATSPDGFDAGEVVEQTLSLEHTVSPDGEYEDGNVRYFAVKSAVIDASNLPDDADDIADIETTVVEDEDWEVFTSESETEVWDEESTVDNALDRYDEEDTVTIDYEREFNTAFSEAGEYAYVLTLAQVNGEYDWEDEDWNFEIEEIDTELYLFQVDAELLSVLSYGRF